MKGSRHGNMKHPSRKLGVKAFLAAGVTTALMAGALVPVNVSLLSEHRAHSSVTTVVGANTIRTVAVADYALLAVKLISVPGTGNSHNPADAESGYAWLDSGVFASIPDKTALLDANVYPAVLGTGGDGVVTGQQSVNMGKEGVIAIISNDGQSKTVYVLVGGSQGAMVVVQTLVALAASGYPMENVYAALYSNPYREGTGFVTRFAPGSWTLNTGLDPGAPQLPPTGTILDVGHESDFMVRSPKYWYNALAWLNGIMGFLVEHGDLGNLNYADPRNTVVVKGNVTEITLHSEFIPLMVPFVGMAKSLGLPSDWLKPMDTILRGLIEPDLEETGTYQFVPGPEGILYRIQRFAQAVTEAFGQVVQLVQGQSLTPTPTTNAESPSQQLVREANERDVQLNPPAAPVAESSTSQSLRLASESPASTPVDSAPEVPVAEPAPSVQSTTVANGSIQTHETTSATTTTDSSTSNKQSDDLSSSQNVDTDKDKDKDEASQVDSSKDDDASDESNTGPTSQSSVSSSSQAESHQSKTGGASAADSSKDSSSSASDSNSGGGDS